MQETAQQRFFDSVRQQVADGSGRIEVPLANETSFESAIHVRESDVPAYELPDPLRLPNGEQIQTPAQWRDEQRERILDVFRRDVYGWVPDRPVEHTYEQLTYAADALEGQAVRKEIRATFKRGRSSVTMDLLIYLPQVALRRAVPIFLGLNFMGNHSIHPDPNIKLSRKWIPDRPEEGVVHHRATDAARGSRHSRWPVRKLLQRGFGLATIYSGDLAADVDDGFQEGIYTLFFGEPRDSPRPKMWGAISAWAWGLQRGLDYCQQDDQINHQQVALIGHSRLGKAALWAGAQDERFALVIANNSGCMGAALSRRRFGETIYAINHVFPHWFCERFKDYNERETSLEVDQHMLIALIAPRPVYVASAQDDLWADPRGEFLALKASEPVYELFGRKGLPVERRPDIGVPVWDALGYHVRAGAHDVTDYDWEQFLRFAERHFISLC